MKKMARSRFVITRDTVVPPVGIVGTKYIQCLVIVDKAGYEQIQLTVVVIVKPHGAGGPAGCGHTCFLGDVSESAVMIIMVEGVLQRGRRCKEIRWSTVDQINIHPTVVVIIQK